MTAPASGRAPEAPNGPVAVEPHSLGKCLFLHLAPGVANIAATVLGLAAFWNPSLPPELFFGVFTNAFVLIPVQLGYLYYLARKRRNPGWSLEGVVVYDRPVSWSRYFLWVPAILAPTALIFVVLEPITTGSKPLPSASASSPDTRGRRFRRPRGSCCPSGRYRSLEYGSGLT